MEETNNKKFYWIKLRTDFFQDDSPIDFLMSQENGAQYVVLYQMLCLKTSNTNGELATHVGEMIIPYDVKKIARDTKYFDVDTVTVALELFKHIGLIFEQDNGNLMISNYSHMIGSESASKAAQKKREYRERIAEKQRALIQEDNSEDITKDSNEDNDKDINEDIRGDKLSDRDKILDINISNINISNSQELDCPTRSDKSNYIFQKETELWNSLKPFGVNPIRGIVSGTKRAKLLNARLGQYGESSFSDIVQEIKDSDFLQGKHNGKPWQVTFDWAILPSNYPKILEGNYRNKGVLPRTKTKAPVEQCDDVNVNRMSDDEWEEFVLSEEWGAK